MVKLLNNVLKDFDLVSGSDTAFCVSELDISISELYTCLTCSLHNFPEFFGSVHMYNII